MDPQQQQQFGALMASMGVAFVIIWLIMWAFFIFLFWRIFSRTGMSGALGLIALIPGLGWIICLCILAFGSWRVTPLPPGYVAGTPAYPPQPYPPAQSTAYPPVSPTNYPPSGPPPQL